MSKNLYLHIGFPKTGTTALQIFCRDNKELLEAHGLYYPEAGRNTGDYISHGNHAHFGLVKPLYSPKCLPDEIWKRLSREIREHGESDILISNEALGLIFDPAHLGPQAFKKINEYCHGYDIKVIAYVRRYDDVFKSSYNQAIKERNKTLPGSDSLGGRFHYEEYLDGIFIWYHKLFNSIIAECRKYLPPGNLICRFYDPARLKNGNIIDDFFDIFQIGLQNVPKGKLANERLPNAVLPILASLFGLKTGRETEIRLQNLINKSFAMGKSSAAVVRRLNQKTIQEHMDQTEALCPGYLDMFAERPFDLSFPETDMEPKERLVFELLFSLYAQNNELRTSLAAAMEILLSRSLLKQEMKTIYRWGFERLRGAWRRAPRPNKAAGTAATSAPPPPPRLAPYSPAYAVFARSNNG